MKKLLFFPALLSLTWLVSCGDSKDDTSLLQTHDANEMMAIMHDMAAEMAAVPKTNDPDHDWAGMMRVHHQGAIEMANLELQKGDDATLRNMATQIISTQQMEIAELTAYLGAHTPHLNKPEFTQKRMENMEHSAKDADLQVLTGDTDYDFASLMLVHHESGIKMSEMLLKYGEDAETRQLAEQIIMGQKQEASEFQDWLLANKKY